MGPTKKQCSRVRGSGQEGVLRLPGRLRRRRGALNHRHAGRQVLPHNLKLHAPLALLCGAGGEGGAGAVRWGRAKWGGLLGAARLGAAGRRCKQRHARRCPGPARAAPAERHPTRCLPFSTASGPPPSPQPSSQAKHPPASSLMRWLMAASSRNATSMAGAPMSASGPLPSRLTAMSASWYSGRRSSSSVVRRATAAVYASGCCCSPSDCSPLCAGGAERAGQGGWAGAVAQVGACAQAAQACCKHAKTSRLDSDQPPASPSRMACTSRTSRGRDSVPSPTTRCASSVGGPLSHTVMPPCVRRVQLCQAPQAARQGTGSMPGHRQRATGTSKRSWPPRQRAMATQPAATPPACAPSSRPAWARRRRWPPRSS